VNINSYFAVKGIGETGLTPKITIRKVSNNTIIVNAQNMTELAVGWYTYSFNNDLGEEYVVNIDGGSALKAADRYQYGEIEKDNPSQMLIDSNIV
jgi:hypothetical protein